MRSSIGRLLAVMAAAMLGLSPILFATSAHADGSVVSYVHSVVASLDDDSGAARNDIGQYGTADPGAARNDIGDYVPPEQPAAPVVTDTGGLDTGTVVLAVAVGAIVVGIGAASFILVRRGHDHHLAHPV